MGQGRATAEGRFDGSRSLGVVGLLVHALGAPTSVLTISLCSIGAFWGSAVTPPSRVAFRGDTPVSKAPRRWSVSAGGLHKLAPPGVDSPGPVNRTRSLQERIAPAMVGCKNVNTHRSGGGPSIPPGIGRHCVRPRCRETSWAPCATAAESHDVRPVGVGETSGDARRQRQTDARGRVTTAYIGREWARAHSLSAVGAGQGMGAEACGGVRRCRGQW